jgi:putative RecB family exonuclease
MGKYSHSKLSCFEQCPFKFKLKYIDKIQPEIEKSIEAHLGTAVHGTLEWLYNQAKENTALTVDEILLRYTEAWQKDFSEAIEIVKQEFTAEDYFNKGVQFLLNYHKKHFPFQDGTLEIEKKITINLGENGKHKIRGFIDRLVFNPTTKAYEVHDYKTSSYLPTQEKIDQDRQLALYSIAIKELYGLDKEVTLIWHYLAHDTKIESNRTNQQLEELKQEIINLINKIETTNEFPKEKSILCDWCEFKNICQEMQRQERVAQFDRFPNIKKYIND